MENAGLNALKTVARGALIVLAGSGVGRLLNYSYKLIVARLGPESFGILSLCVTLLGIASTLAFLGLPEGVKRYISFYQGKNDSQKLRATIQSSLVLSTIAACLLAGVIFLAAESIAKLFFHNATSAAYVYFVAAILPFYVVNWICIKCFAGFKNLKFRVFVYDIGENAFKIAFTVVLLMLGFKLWSALLGYGLAIICCSLLSLYLLEFKVFSVLRGPYRGQVMHNELLQFSLPLLFSGLMIFVLSWTDTLMLGYFSSMTNVGLYSAALLISSLVFIGTDLLTPIYLPVVTELYARKEKAQITSVFESVNKWVFAICLPLAFLTFIFARQLLAIFFPQEFGVAYGALVLLTAGRLVYAFSFTSLHMLNMIERTRIIFVTSAIATALNVVLNYLFIPRYGIVGAAAATAFSLTLQALLLIGLNVKYLRLHVFSPATAKVALAAFLPALALYWLQYYCARTLVVFFSLSALYMLIYAALLYFLKAYDDKDNAIVKMIIQRRA
ncbi:MAG: flippase [Candidatus Omnitrophota bacterium]